MNNDPAFPVLIVNRPKKLHKYNGMTLRDYFAAKAMAGIMAIPDHWYQNNPEDIAEEAYVMADAMLKAREA
jgi:hypothetical protein